MFTDDKTALERLKSNLEGESEYVEDNWESDESPDISYAKASQEIKGSKGENVLFVDKHILPKSHANTLIRSFVLLENIDLSQFVSEPPKFQRLKRGNYCCPYHKQEKKFQYIFLFYQKCHNPNLFNTKGNAPVSSGAPVDVIVD